MRPFEPMTGPAFADKLATLPWIPVLDRCARRVNPLLGGCLGSMSYYWVTAQTEFSTDVFFKRRADLTELMPRLLEHSILSFDARDVMSFLGRKLLGACRKIRQPPCILLKRRADL